jgi:hypothetical protein
VFILKQFLLATLTIGYAGYFRKYFAAQEWHCLFSLLRRETRMWAVTIAWRKIYFLEYSPLKNTTKYVDRVHFTSHITITYHVLLLRPSSDAAMKLHKNVKILPITWL